MPNNTQLTVFLTEDDEHALLADVGALFPWLTLFRDAGATVKRVQELGDAVQIWIPAVPVTEETPKRGTPQLQFQRSRVLPSRLLPGQHEMRAGRLAIVLERGEHEEEAEAFVERVWKQVKAFCTSEVERVNPASGVRLGREKGVWLGPGAVRWSTEGRILAGRTANLYFAYAPRKPRRA